MTFLRRKKSHDGKSHVSLLGTIISIISPGPQSRDARMRSSSLLRREKRRLTRYGIPGKAPGYVREQGRPNVTSFTSHSVSLSARNHRSELLCALSLHNKFCHRSLETMDYIWNYLVLYLYCLSVTLFLLYFCCSELDVKV